MRAFIVAAALLAGACAEPQKTIWDLDQVAKDYARDNPAQQAAPPPATDACGMTGFSHLIGAPGADIDRANLPASARIIAPDSAVTDDHVPARLNVHTDAEGRVTSLACG